MDKERKISLPYREALWISLENIKKRMTRSSIVGASVALGVAFLTHMTLTNTIFNAYTNQSGFMMEAYQSWLVIVSFFVCCVTLTNSMVIATYERYREIGTMKCLGALDSHILKLFIIEALVLGFFGGISGFILGLITSIISSSIQLGITTIGIIISYEMIINFGRALILSVALSIIASAYPAFRAAKSNPIEALKQDV